MAEMMMNTFGAPLSDYELDFVTGGAGGSDNCLEDEEDRDIEECRERITSPTPKKKNGLDRNKTTTIVRTALNIISGAKCFAAGSKVSTPDGAKNIEEIQVGDEIISLDNEGNKRIGKVIEVEPVNQERIVEVIFSNGTKWETTATQWFYCGGNDYACVMNSADKRAILEVGGAAKVESVTVTERVEKVYDFVVNELNVMFINGIASEGFSLD